MNRRAFGTGLSAMGAGGLAGVAPSAVDARSGTPWLRINRVLRVMLHTRRSAEAWSEGVEFKRALALRSEIRRAGWFN